MEEVEKVIRENTRKIGAAVFSAGLALSAAAGLPLLEDLDDGDSSQPLEETVQQDEGADKVSKQIDQRQQKLETVSSEGEEDMDYTRLSC